MRGSREPPESLARGTLSEGFPTNVGDLLVSAVRGGTAWSRETEDRRDGRGGVLEARTTDEGGELACPEPTGGKGRTSGRPDEGIHGGTPRSSTMSTQLDRLSELATADKTTRFFLSLAHLLTPAALMAAFEGLRKDASAGVDGVTYREYEQDVWRNIPTLHHRLVSHQYRAQPLRRVYIPKENGKERPISIPALEDKIVQKATVTVLTLPHPDHLRPVTRPRTGLVSTEKSRGNPGYRATKAWQRRNVMST